MLKIKCHIMLLQCIIFISIQGECKSYNIGYKKYIILTNSIYLFDMLILIIHEYFEMFTFDTGFQFVI